MIIILYISQFTIINYVIILFSLTTLLYHIAIMLFFNKKFVLFRYTGIAYKG